MRALRRVVLAAVLLVAVGTEAQALVPQLQDRSVRLERTYVGNRCEYPPPFSCTSPDCGLDTDAVLDEETAPDFELFNASVSLEGPPGSGASGSASQNSAIETNGIVASGSYSGLGGYGGEFDFCGNPWDASCSFDADSWFSVSFDVATATPYTLTGTLGAPTNSFEDPNVHRSISRTLAGAAERLPTGGHERMRRGPAPETTEPLRQRSAARSSNAAVHGLGVHDANFAAPRLRSERE